MIVSTRRTPGQCTITFSVRPFYTKVLAPFKYLHLSGAETLVDAQGTDP